MYVHCRINLSVPYRDETSQTRLRKPRNLVSRLESDCFFSIFGPLLCKWMILCMDFMWISLFPCLDTKNKARGIEISVVRIT